MKQEGELVEAASLSGVLLFAAVAQVRGFKYGIEYMPTKPPKPTAVFLIKDGRPDFSAGPFVPGDDEDALRNEVEQHAGPTIVLPVPR